MAECKTTVDQLHNLPALMRPKEVSELTGEHLRTVQYRCARGEIPCIKVGNAYRIVTELFLRDLFGGRNA